MSLRSAAIDTSHNQFLQQAGWADASCEALTGDASTRKYFRIRQGSRTAILMDASLNHESVAPFVALDEHLRRLGFRAPEILAQDLEQGLLLLEDFGDDTFASLLEQGADPEPLYAIAIDALIALHQKTDAVPASLRVYHPAKMLEDIELFLEWRVPDSSETVKQEFRKVWNEVLPAAHQVPASLLLRDYHVANLMMRPRAAGLDRAGILDFQDAYAGPVTYDLVSLLEDARRDLPDGLDESMRARYLDQFPKLDRGAFEASCAVVAAQRHTRVLAIFERLSRREGRHHYKTQHSPRVERRLSKALGHPILAGVKHWMTRYAGSN